MFCPKCGKELKAEAPFCRYCGVNIKSIREGMSDGGSPPSPAPPPIPNPPPPIPQPDNKEQPSVPDSGSKPWEHDVRSEIARIDNKEQEEVTRLDLGISGNGSQENGNPAPPPYPAPAPYPTPYPVPAPKPSSRNVVGFVFSLLGILSVIIAFIAAVSAKKTIKVSSYKFDYDVDDSLASLSIVLAVFGFIFGLIGLLISPKNEKRSSLGTCGLALGIAAMGISIITIIVSLILNT